ncbi:protein dopey-2 isoform X1 [Myiozetetes cayanensis]|uniref:protein dopey-2 isoform X1 n=2 Tax=Myiozetetes cayanensis TaxID=478635 RepID=UPI00215E1C5D|nr:protein dopey-2 isoform X1 [Myiozetetes cayanensis]XP_050188716.1 protein dopey-2 isoform X2 [Myiozetetes cayanensis]XP_050188717.1 protein dopey-2 isoform X1 [Myiozetetes cayanensis]XP_050188718.1 protein dopey-2 isoform X1 [Myiozetetes cayanensis]
MDPEEQDLLGDYRYRNYSSAIEKALRNFESSSEWADLISSLGKLNKALQSNLKYSLLPRRLIISKRLSQCLHPALPSGVHLKALETYEIIFKIIGTKWLAKDLFLYSSGLFPLLANAAMSVRPVLLGLYEKYFLPLQKSLLPGLQAFLIGLLPGLEEGSEIYDRTDALLVKLSLLMGQEVFYGALWGSVLVSPSIRLPASLFVVTHIDRELSGKQQKFMLGTDHKLTIKSLCVSVLDSNVLVQRNTLEAILFFFPFYTALDCNESSILLPRADLIYILSAATQTLLRRDMSLNRRLYAWLLGSDIKGGTFAPDSTASEDQAVYFFGKYSKDLLVESLVVILHQKFPESDNPEEQHQAYLKPFRILISLLDKPEIGPQVVGDLFLEVLRAFYSYCKDALGSDLKLSYNQSGNTLASAIKENKNASEIVKTVNLLITSLSTDFLWDYMTRCFEDCFRNKSSEMRYPLENVSTPPTIAELCTLLVFLLDVIPLELYSEVQTQYLPQMLSYMVQSLLENMELLSLPELTHALKTCFKVLSKVQMPPSYLDIETGSGDGSPVPKEDVDMPLDPKAALQEEEEAPFQPLKSEDSGIGLSASSPELSQHLGVPTVTLERDDIWKKGGSIQKTLFCIQELVAKFSSKYIFGVQLHEPSNEGVAAATNPGGKERKENGYRFPESGSKKKSPWDAKQITVPQVKQMLSELFSARGSPFRNKSSDPLLPAHDSGNKKEKEEEEWDLEQVMLVLGPLKGDCKEAFSAACHLLLDCTTFPVYLSEEEMEQLYLSLFEAPGGCDATFPLWLRSLMTICCCVSDCYVQNVSIFTLLEVINHSQSLALVIEDRMKRSKVSGHNPFLGKLQMVTLPPIAPAVLKMISEKTDFYQRVACVLWNQLNKETREHHIPCVELFYRLHCLAPSANICEDIICHALLDRDKGTRLEALFRFSVMWHLTREIQGSRVTSHNRSFDRSLFVVLDSLNCSDGAIGAAAQGWLIRALSLNDVARILEPVLLLLLHPRTQRTSIHCIKQQHSADFIHDWLCKKKAPLKEPAMSESNSEENLPLSQFTTVDREAIWAEVEKDPEKVELKPEQPENDALCDATISRDADGDQDNSEHTESADTSTGHDSENTSSFSPSLELQEGSNEGSEREAPNPGKVLLSDSSRSSAAPDLVRADSERTQASESLSSDEEVDLELQEITHSRLLKQQKEKQELVEALFKHMLLYLQPYDSRRVLYAFSVLEAVLKTNPKEFIEAVASTSMDTSSTAHLNLIYNLLARHQEALVGQSFYGKLQPQSPTVCPHSLLIELLTYLCLSFLRSYYPCCLKVTHRDLLGNRDVQVKSVEVLIRVVAQLAAVAKAAESRSVEFIRSLLARCKVQEFVLLSLSASMYVSQKRYQLLLADGASPGAEEELFEESLINFGHDQIWSEHPLQIELLKLLQVLIVLEHHLGQSPEEQENQPDLSKEWQQALNFQQAIGAMQYVYPHPITSQGLFVSAVVRGLQPEYGHGMHPTWVGLVTSSLPYFGKSLGWTVAPFVVQICKNLDELVKQYENEAVKASPKTSASLTSKRENVTPDYPLTLLEGLTTIGHFCLLDHPNPTKKSCLAEPANLRNARNAILEELPRIINTLSLLWGVIKREDSQKRPTDFFGTTKGSSSVYFKATKTLRMKILDFLNPLTAQLGMQLMAAIAAVWNSKKPHRSQSKTKILPVASASQLVLVDLICALNTLKIDTILHLIKEVVKKPAQIKGEEKSSLVDIPMLQFSYAFIQRLPVSALQENFQPLLGLLKESVQLNLAPPGHFLLLSTLNDFVTRTPSLENKKDQKDLQEVTQKILEAVGTVAGSSLEQTSWLSRNLEVKAQPQILPDDFNMDDVNDTSVAPSSMVSASAPSIYSVQALSLLAEVLASLLDMVYRSDEKDKAVPLISRLLYYVFPYLRNHSAYNIPSFRAGAQLLSSLSGYAYTKRAWKKEVLELYMDPSFFQMDTSCTHWRSIIDHLLTHEKTMFKDLMNMQSSALKLYPSCEQKAMLLKRQAFAVFSGETDQYHLYLPLIQERLTENLRVGQTSLVAAQMFLFFRVLLLRISPQHLTSLWPIMVTELIQTFLQLEEDLTEEEEPSKSSSRTSRQRAGDASGADIQHNELSLYLAACKFLDTALSFPPDRMHLFQMYKWAFVPEVDTESCPVTSHLVENHQECRPHIVRIMDLLKMKYREPNHMEGIPKRHRFPLLTLRSVSSITQLVPFFHTLCRAFTANSGQSQNSHPSPAVSMDFAGSNSTKILQQLEDSVECDFLENMEG